MTLSNETTNNNDNKIPGNLHVADDVLANIAGNAALECYGVVGMTSPDAINGLSSILPANRLQRGIVIENTDAGVHVDLYVVIEYGTNVQTVSKNLKESVTFALEHYVCVKLSDVVVHVQEIKVHTK